MGEPKNLYFYDFESFKRVPGSQNQQYLIFEIPGYLTQIIKKNMEPFLKSYFINLEISEITSL